MFLNNFFIILYRNNFKYLIDNNKTYMYNVDLIENYYY